MITINEYLDGILEDFKEYVSATDKLCDLLDAHFDRGQIPDYSDIHVQQLYLLRYAYAYALEYKYMYDTLINSFSNNRQIEVTSVGCGSLIDYWALTRVVQEKCNKCSIKYTGIDTIDWNYKMPPRKCDNVEYLTKNAIALCQNAKCFSSDIYIFPKSISEFVPGDVSLLANCLSPNRIQKNLVFLMFSLRTDTTSMKLDVMKTKILYERMLKCGFHTNDSSTNHTCFPDAIKDRSICRVDDDFSHPRNVINYLKPLYEECTDYGWCQNSDICKQRLSRLPILTCKYAAWQIFKFER